MVSPASSTLYQFATLCKPKNPNLFVNIAKSVRVAHMSHQNPSIRQNPNLWQPCILYVPVCVWCTLMSVYVPVCVWCTLINVWHIVCAYVCMVYSN